MDERKRTKPLEVLSRYKFVLLAAALGAALLLWPAGPGAPEAADSRADAAPSPRASTRRESWYSLYRPLSLPRRRRTGCSPARGRTDSHPASPSPAARKAISIGRIPGGK